MTQEREDWSKPRDSFTVGEVASMLRHDAWKIGGCALLVASCFAVASLMMAETWKASIQVVPTEMPPSEQLGALAEVLSKKAGSGSADIDLFSALLVSRPVLERLMASKVVKPSVSRDSIVSVQLELGIDSSKPEAVYNAVKALKQQITLAQQQSSLSNIVEVGVKANSPWLAKGMLANLLEIGQASLLDVTRYRFLTVIRRLEQADSVAGGKAREAADAYTVFLDENRSSALPSVLQRAECLRREKEIRDQTYSMVRAELEQNRLELEKIMPPVVPIDSAYVPPYRESPRRTMLVVAGFLLGLLGSSAMFLLLRMRNGSRA